MSHATLCTSSAHVCGLLSVMGDVLAALQHLDDAIQFGRDGCPARDDAIRTLGVNRGVLAVPECTSRAARDAVVRVIRCFAELLRGGR